MCVGKGPDQTRFFLSSNACVCVCVLLLLLRRAVRCGAVSAVRKCVGGDRRCALRLFLPWLCFSLRLEWDTGRPVTADARTHVHVASCRVVSLGCFNFRSW